MAAKRGAASTDAWAGMWRAAAAIRVVLVLYAEWHDSSFAVKYTDVDYLVFSDAARFVAHGASPFARATYRYTPLLAYALVPNVWLHRIWGKIVFAATDLLCGALIGRIVVLQSDGEDAVRLEERRRLLVGAWLFNPIVINVSTRGNAEALVSLLVLACLWAVLARRTVFGAVMLGLAVHMKLYPIIYALPLYLAIEPTACGPAKERPERASGWTRCHAAVRRFFSVQRLVRVCVRMMWIHIYTVYAICSIRIRGTCVSQRCAARRFFSVQRLLCVCGVCVCVCVCVCARACL